MTNALKNFPKFLHAHLVGLLIAALTEFEHLALIGVGVLLGFAFNPFIGSAVALGAYVALRMSVFIANGVSRDIRFVGECIRDNPYFIEKYSRMRAEENVVVKQTAAADDFFGR